MELTLNYMMQILGECLQQEASAEEKIMQVETWYNAALKHIPKDEEDVRGGEEIEKEKRSKKEKNKEDGVAPLKPFIARDSSNTPTPLENLTMLKPQKIRRLIAVEFLDYIEQKWLIPRYHGLMTDIKSPLSGAQYLSWLTRYPRELVDKKLLSLETHPTHYGRVCVASTINDWLRDDANKMTVLTRKEWNRKFREQKPVILALINKHLKQKQNGKQTTLDFGADPEDTASEQVD